MNLLRKYYRIKQAAGVNIHLAAGESLPVIDACLLAVSTDQLVFEQQISGLGSIAELAKKLAAKVPVSVNLTGKGVLTKILEGNVQVSRENFSMVLPNADIADFYVQQVTGSDKTFVSVIRRAEADKWLDGLRDQGLLPLMLSLGPFVVEQISAQLNNYGGPLRFNGHIITRNEERQWTAYHYEHGATSPFPFKADNEPLREQLLLPYAAGFQLILAERIMPVKATVPALEAKLIYQLGLNKFKVQLAVLIGFTFVVLLLNYLALSYLRERNAGLLDRVNSTNTNQADIGLLNEQVLKKEMLLKELGWDGGLDKSRNVAQLGQVMPPEITLQEIAINPVDNVASRTLKKLSFVKRQLRIQGSCPEILPVNEWMARMKTFKWVKTIQMESYGFDNELGTGSFVLIINY